MTSPTSFSQPATTGRYLVLMDNDAIDSGIQTLSDRAGVTSVARAADFADSAPSADQLSGDSPVVLDDIGVAVVSLDPDQVQSLNVAAASTDAVMAVEPERVVYALANEMMPPGHLETLPSRSSDGTASSTANVSVEYLKGYRDAINQLVEQLLPKASKGEIADIEEELASAMNTSVTWGLTRTRVTISSRSGIGIRVAVLDTGFDLTHPDFFGRTIVSKSFIDGEDVQDANGHGTHCIGTACGPQMPPTLPRYGVAYNAEIYAGKVLSNAGSGSDGGILAGINWAIANNCPVISMSLGAPVTAGQTFSRVYESVGRRALDRGSLIIAAAGNDSWRQYGVTAPVSHPANCPSVMAVAAIDNQLRMATFSNGGINPNGGQVDVAGPGVDVYSTWPMPTRYNTISGTSMATPHVAGIAALYAEATGARGRNLWMQLTQGSRRLTLSSADVGSGLVQAIR